MTRWSDVDPTVHPYDRAALTTAMREILARHPNQHDEWRLGWEIDEALQRDHAWLTQTNRWPRLVGLERPWLALGPAEEAARIERGTAALLDGFDRRRAYYVTLSETFASVPRPTFDGVVEATARLTVALNGIITAAPQLDETEDYLELFRWYLESLGVAVSVARAAVANELPEDDLPWMPGAERDRWIEQLAEGLAHYLVAAAGIPR